MKMIGLLVTIIGILLALPLLGLEIGASLSSWIIAIAVLIIGIGRLAGKL